MFGIIKRLWSAAGYSTEVTLAFFRMYQINLDDMAKRARRERTLSDFCDEAQKSGLSAQDCARLIYESGYEDTSVLRQGAGVPTPSADESYRLSAMAPTDAVSFFVGTQSRFKALKKQFTEAGLSEEYQATVSLSI
jgi:hypothetical protein